MINYVCGFIRSDACVILIEKNSGWQDGLHNGIGGKIKSGETPVEAMVRECKEETDLYIPEEHWVHRLTLLHGDAWQVHFFIVEDDSLNPGDLLPQVTDEGVVAWCEIDCPPSNMIHNLCWIIPLCFDKETNGPITMFCPEVSSV